MRGRYYSLFIIMVLFLEGCTPKNRVTIPTDYYSEPHRLQFHFSPEKNWMNDPNGMVYYEGEYHLFYQCYPDSNVWGPMHWGHAVSKDLVRWQHLPIALYPDNLGLIFSGSTVVDYKNTSGWGFPDNPAMIAIFTQHLMEGEKKGRHDFQTQSIAYSLDKGRTWKKYEHNPILKNVGKHDFRDPKVFWHDASNQWVMTVAVKDHIELYGSPNLKTWSQLSDFGYDIGAHGGVWECPDLFELKVSGTNKKKWILLISINPGGANGGSGTQYFIGQFDGNKFIPDTENSYWLDYGKDNYAGVTWSNITDGRRLFLGWMSNWQYATVVPTTAWRSAMTVPRTLELIETESGLRIASQPVNELTTLRVDSTSYDFAMKVDEIESEIIQLTTPQNEIDLNIERESIEGGFEIELSNKKDERIVIGLNEKNQLFIDRTQAGNEFSKDFVGIHTGIRTYLTSGIKLKLLIDASSIELFADDGTTVITELFFPMEPFNQLRFYSKKGITVKSMKTYSMKSIWH